ncbi:MAG: DUF5597 domain-containing protein [Christensenellales bacterium]|jgi:hypothetical protein
MSIPTLKGRGRLATLYVHDAPFVCLGGEIHNSSASSLDYMERKVWPALRPMHLNCVLAPVSWELTEPEPDKFDFTLVDGLIAQCRREGVKLIPLWFGLWKSTFASYAPGWVKRDWRRYPRVHTAAGAPLDTFSPLGEASIAADATAFAALMAHIRQVDERENTVVMVQVENECGMFGAAREYGQAADAAFAAAVPPALAARYGVSGPWAEAFGPDAEEFFSAWCFARAVETVARAGQAAYDLPMFHNAWLETPPFGPGRNYPSGGCVAKCLTVWQTGAPSLCCFGPNAYGDVRPISDAYAACDNPIFIPETGGGPGAAAGALYAVGRHNALGFAPFGAERIWGVPMGLMDDPFAPAGAPVDRASPQRLAAAYDLIASLHPLIHRAHQDGRIYAFKESGDRGAVIETGKYRILVAYSDAPTAFTPGGGMPFPPPKQPGAPEGGGLIIQEDEDTFLAAGLGYRLEFLPLPGSAGAVTYEFIEEGVYQDGAWRPGRRINGDEARQGLKLGDMPEVRRVRVYTYQ